MDPTPAHTRAAEDVAGLTDWLRTLPQHLLPTHALSRVVHRATRSTVGWWKDLLIDLFDGLFDIDLCEAAERNKRAYPSFNAFFTRALQPGARPLEGDGTTLVNPVDGAVCYCGPLDGAPLRAKGHRFGLPELLGGSAERAAPFVGGTVANLYLHPRDYHRVHMPLAGRLVEMVHVPGRLFAVNPPAMRTVTGLFARNERVVLHFETTVGPVAIVLVGALFVGSIETTWGGEITPPHRREVTVTRYPGDSGPTLQRGDELGRFNMGSTVILLLPPGAATLRDGLDADQELSMGRRLGTLHPPA
ncbi:MAG: archaetidylserine decarboxylase [Gammaproteobacteria bacterium]|nr:archaetidylserine decarboxylase [Gammaproteobacteria bacterium]